MKPKWTLRKFKNMRFKLYEETAERFEHLIKFENPNATLQSDMEAYVIWRLKGGVLK